MCVSVFKVETHLLGRRGAAGRAHAEAGTSLVAAVAAAAVAADLHSSEVAQGRAAPFPQERFPFAFFRICRGQSVSLDVQRRRSVVMHQVLLS